MELLSVEENVTDGDRPVDVPLPRPRTPSLQATARDRVRLGWPGGLCRRSAPGPGALMALAAAVLRGSHGHCGGRPLRHGPPRFGCSPRGLGRGGPRGVVSVGVADAHGPVTQALGWIMRRSPARGKAGAGASKQLSTARASSATARYPLARKQAYALVALLRVRVGGAFDLDALAFLLAVLDRAVTTINPSASAAAAAAIDAGDDSRVIGAGIAEVQLNVVAGQRHVVPARIRRQGLRRTARCGP